MGPQPQASFTRTGAWLSVWFYYKKVMYRLCKKLVNAATFRGLRGRGSVCARVTTRPKESPCPSASEGFVRGALSCSQMREKVGDRKGRVFQCERSHLKGKARSYVTARRGA